MVLLGASSAYFNIKISSVRDWTIEIFIAFSSHFPKTKNSGWQLKFITFLFILEHTEFPSPYEIVTNLDYI